MTAKRLALAFLVFVLFFHHKTSAQVQYRLKVMTDSCFRYPDRILDSTTYFYGPNGSSDCNLSIFNYDSTVLDHWMVPAGRSPWIEASSQKFDANNRVSRKVDYTGPYGQVSFLKQTWYTYYPNGNMETKLEQVFNTTAQRWINSSKDSFIYDNNNNVVDYVHLSWDANGNNPYVDGVMSYSYNGNELVSKMVRTLDNGTNTLQNYMLDTSSWINSNQRAHWVMMWYNNTWTIDQFDLSFYNASHAKVISLRNRYNLATGNWVNKMRDSTVYFGQQSTMAYSGSWDDVSSSFVPVSKDSVFYHTNGLPEYHIYWNWDGSINRYVNVSRWTTSYTSFGQPELKQEQDWDQSNNRWSNLRLGHPWTRFFYEAYQSTNVQSPGIADAALRVFPNPASGQLNIELELSREQDCLMSIYGLDGKLHRQWKASAKNGRYSATVPLSGIPSGNYLLKAGSQPGAPYRLFQVN